MRRASMKELDWVIVGGGPHGVCAARALADAGSALRIVDPSGQLLSRWSDRSAKLDMAWMRSPLSHHLDAYPSSLDHFLHRPENGDVAERAGTFRRPRHDAFVRHSLDVACRSRLDEALIRGRVEAIKQSDGSLLVSGDGFELKTRRVLLATGSNRPRVPQWARELQRQGAPVEHVFDGEAVAHFDIIGGSISAVQRALKVHRDTGQTVRLWMRRPIRVADFDVDRPWIKHRFLGRWSRLEVAERMDFLQRNPGGGSVPPGLESRLARAVRRGAIELHHEVPSVIWNAETGRLTLQGQDMKLESTGITLVTGLEPERVSGWIRTLCHDLQLPTAEGIPLLGPDMEWGHGIHVCGPLARLALGPMAPHLIGARWATSKLPGVRMQPA